MAARKKWPRWAATSSTGCSKSSVDRLVLGAAAATFAEVVDVQRFDELLEHRELLLVDLGGFLGFDAFRFGLFVLEDQAGLLEDGLLDVDRHLRPNRQRDGVRRTSVNLDVS